MKKFYLILAAIVLASFCFRSAPKEATHQPDVIIDVLDPSLTDYANAWQTEVGRRFHNTVVVLCHGGDAVEGEWLVLPYGGPGGCWHIDRLIKEEQAKYPGRTLVILSCNPHHETIHGYPNVWYAPSSVWCQPDRAVIDAATPTQRFTLDGRSDADPDDVGNVFEFQSAE